MALVFTLAGVLCAVLGVLCGPTGNSTSVVNLVNAASDEGSHHPIYGVDKGRISPHIPRSAPGSSNTTLSFSVSIDTNAVLHTVDRRYLSTGFGTQYVTRVDEGWFDPKSPIQQTLLRGLSPAVFRVGGRSGDETLFAANGSLNDISRRWIHVDHILTGEMWKSLNKFTTKCGVDLAFTLNVITRKGESWDPTNTKELLDFNADLGYRVIWQLGNEPNLFRKNYMTTISARQLAKDFITLRGILSMDRYRYSSELVGPDTTHLSITHCVEPDMPENLSSNSTAYLERFLREAGDSINATTVHFYNMRGKDNNISITNFTDPDVFMRLRCELIRLRKAMKNFKSTGSRVKWLGETSSVTNGGTSDLSNRYLAGFLILHNLGIAAQMGISIFVYWNFLGGSYGLLEHNSDKTIPSPLYWTCFMHKRLLGTHVLSVSYAIVGYSGDDMAAKKNKSYVHVFAHCTRVSPLYPAGAVTVMALNLHNNSEASLHLTGDLASKNVDEYLLQPEGGNLTGSNVTLNGQVLKMKNSTHFPDIIPRPLPIGSPIVLPPMTYGFYVIRDANAPVCLKTNRDLVSNPEVVKLQIKK